MDLVTFDGRDKFWDLDYWCDIYMSQVSQLQKAVQPWTWTTDGAPPTYIGAKELINSRERRRKDGFI